MVDEIQPYKFSIFPKADTAVVRIGNRDVKVDSLKIDVPTWAEWVPGVGVTIAGMGRATFCETRFDGNKTISCHITENGKVGVDG